MIGDFLDCSNEAFINYFDIFKAITPFLVVIFVYLAWHLQKGKEVIASEAKNILVKLNELMDLNNRGYIKFREALRILESAESLEEISRIHEMVRDILFSLELKKNEIFLLLEFLEEATLDKDFKDECARFKIAVSNGLQDFNSKFDTNNSISIRPLSDTNSFMEKAISKLKKSILKYAMYRN